jgi:hypothetical protein
MFLLLNSEPRRSSLFLLKQKSSQMTLPITIITLKFHLSLRPRSFLPNQARLRLDWSPIQVIFQAQEKNLDSDFFCV